MASEGLTVSDVLKEIAQAFTEGKITMDEALGQAKAAFERFIDGVRSVNLLTSTSYGFDLEDAERYKEEALLEFAMVLVDLNLYRVDALARCFFTREFD